MRFEESIFYFAAEDKAFSIIPDAKTTPRATIKIPNDFIRVIVSPKKKKPPIKASIGVKAPNAAVCAAVGAPVRPAMPPMVAPASAAACCAAVING